MLHPGLSHELSHRLHLGHEPLIITIRLPPIVHHLPEHLHERRQLVTQCLGLGGGQLGRGAAQQRGPLAVLLP